MATLDAPRGTLNLRIPDDTRALIGRAAQAGGQTITTFVLEAARKAAAEKVLDQTFFMVSEETHAAFLARLDAPAQPSDELRRTMQAVPPWEPR